MKHQAVKSGHIESVAHKGTVLHVKFRRGDVYEYLNVTEEQFNELMGAESVGKHLNALGLKGRKVTT
jgi:hypothetical protein